MQWSEDRDGDMAAIPDAAVRCGPRRDRNDVTDPPVVVEVPSPSTTHIDRGARFDFHSGLPSLHQIVFVDQCQFRVEHVRRSAEGRTPIEPVRATDPSKLGVIAVSVTPDRPHFEVPALRTTDPIPSSAEDPPVPVP